MKNKQIISIRSFSKKLKVEPSLDGEVLLTVEFNDKEDVLNQILESVTLEEIFKMFDLEVVEETFKVLKEK